MKEEQSASIEVDPCTGFPTINKSKLSIPTIPTIIWTKYRRSSVSPETSKNVAESEAEPSLDKINPLFQGIERRNQGHIGLILTLLSAITFSFNVLIIKLLSHCHPFSLGVWTFLLMTIFSVIFLIYEVKIKTKKSIFEEFDVANVDNERSPVHFQLCIRGFFGTSALILFYYAVKYLTVADALIIDASSPIFVYLMAHIILREEIGIFPVFTALLAMTGVGFIARPPLLVGGDDSEYNLNTLIGVVLAFLAMICISTTVISLKFLENMHFAAVNTMFGLWGTVQCLLISLITGVFSVPSEISDVFLILGSSALFFLGQVLITLAAHYEDAGPIGMVRTTEVLFIFLWQYIFLGVIPDIYSYFGAFLVLLGVVLLITRKWVTTMAARGEVRNTLCKFFLY